MGIEKFSPGIRESWNFCGSIEGVEKIEDQGMDPFWSARQHHDYQLEGNPVGYYVPGMNFEDRGNVLILAHKNWVNPDISEKMLEDDLIVEIDDTGNILWQWVAGEHFKEIKDE